MINPIVADPWSMTLMGKKSKAKRAEAWQRRQPLNSKKEVGKREVIDEVTGLKVHVPVYAVQASWDDPKVVRDEINRINDEIDVVGYRLNAFAKQIEELETLLREGPAKLESLKSLVTKETARRERLEEKKVDTQLRLGGALVQKDVERLTAKLLEAQKLADALKSGSPLPKKTVVTHKAETWIATATVGDTEYIPPSGEKAGTGVANVDPRIAAAELRRKIASRS